MGPTFMFVRRWTPLCFALSRARAAATPNKITQPALTNIPVQFGATEASTHSAAINFSSARLLKARQRHQSTSLGCCELQVVGGTCTCLDMNMSE